MISGRFSSYPITCSQRGSDIETAWRELGIGRPSGSAPSATGLTGSGIKLDQIFVTIRVTGRLGSASAFWASSTQLRDYLITSRHFVRGIGSWQGKDNPPP